MTDWADEVIDNLLEREFEADEAYFNRLLYRRGRWMALVGRRRNFNLAPDLWQTAHQPRGG